MKIYKMYQVYFFILAILLAISSCGQTGPLYLPETENFDEKNLVELEITSQTKRD